LHSEIRFIGAGLFIVSGSRVWENTPAANLGRTDISRGNPDRIPHTASRRWNQKIMARVSRSLSDGSNTKSSLLFDFWM
jgi:hypothetical protein